MVKPKDPVRVKLGRRSRNKGRTWEQTIARELRPIFGEQVYRGDQRRCGGAAEGEGCDVEGTPFYLEAKHAKGPVSIWAALHQARTKQAEKGDTRPRVIIAKTDKKPAVGRWEPPVAAMELDDFLDVIADLHRLRALYNALKAHGLDGLPKEVAEAFEEI